MTSDHKEILEMQRCFYRDLYKADKSVYFDAENSFSVGLTLEELQDTEAKISFEEFSVAVKQLKNGKCPGLDVFYSKIGRLMYEVSIQS